jgi:hypothetical protein
MVAEGVQVVIDDVRWLRAQAGLDLQFTHICTLTPFPLYFPLYHTHLSPGAMENEADTKAAKALAVIDHACDPEDD